MRKNQITESVSGVNFAAAPGEVTAAVGVGAFGQHPVNQGAHAVALFDDEAERLKGNDRYGAPFAVFELSFNIPFAIPFAVGAERIVAAGS